MLRRPHNKEGPPVFSHEFVIQNHADIISCLCMVVFMGLIPQFSNQLASSIIFVQYNKTVEPDQTIKDSYSTRLDDKPLAATYYQHGIMDIINVVFYAFVWVIIHALLQEYIWERTAKRLHLSKMKQSKYYDSGCMVVFFFVSLAWGINHVIQEEFLWKWNMLYSDYPHNLMSLSLKFFMLTQMAFWLHCYPELYFMKSKKYNLSSKLGLYTSSLLIIAGAYFVKLQRLAVLLLVLHYSVELLFHVCCLLHYHNRNSIAMSGFRLWVFLFVLVRIMMVMIAVLILWFGLGKVHSQRNHAPPLAATGIPRDTASEGVEEGQVDMDEEDVPLKYFMDFTEPKYRLCGLGVVILLQIWLGWTFLNKLMERSAPSLIEAKSKTKIGGKKKNQGDGKKTMNVKSKKSS